MKQPTFEKNINPNLDSIIIDEPGNELTETWYHYHPEPELTLVLYGGGQVLYDTTVMTFHAGDLALIGSNIPHVYIPKETTQNRVVKFSSDFTKAILALPEFAEICKLFEQAEDGVLLFENSPHYGEEVRKFEELKGFALWIQACQFLEHLTHVEHHNAILRGDTRDIVDNIDEKRIGNAVNFIQQNYTNKILLEDAAKAAGMETESFRRFFRHSLRMTFSEYLLNLRILHAQKQLRDTEKNILDISQESGFTNLSNFNRLFAKRCHMTPRDYRKLIKQ